MNANVRRLARRYFDEYSLQFRTVWQLYLTFYVAFLTLNGGGLGLTVQYVTAPRAKMVIALTFIFQNMLAAGTAVMISRYSSTIAERVRQLARVSADIEDGSEVDLRVFRDSPIPGEIGRWGGVANLIGHILFVVLWGAVAVVDFQV